MPNVLRPIAVVAIAALVASIGQPVEAARKHRLTAAISATSPRFDVDVFARGSTNLYNPDAVVVTRHFVFVDYQNDSDTAPTSSIIVKYDRAGHQLGLVAVFGRCDGMRYNPYAHKLWALVNNDGANGSPPRQPALFVIDPKTLEKTKYAFPATQEHGGGYDDLAFVNGRAFASASAPTLTAAGINDKQAVVQLQLRAGTVSVTPLFYGNATGRDIVTGKVGPLNISDPDSLAVAGTSLVVVSEGDGQLAIVAHPGESTQSISRLPTGSQLDEVAQTTGTSGTFFVADSTLDTIYAVRARFPVGTFFVEAPQGAPTQSFIGTLDPTSGVLTPLLTQRDGIVDPTTLVFVPASGADEE